MSDKGLVYDLFYWLTIGLVVLVLLAAVAGLIGGSIALYRHLSDPQENTITSD